MPSPVVLKMRPRCFDQRIDQFTPVALENGEGFFLVRAHQPRISDDIGAKDRRQPPLYPFLRQSLAPREEKRG
jgi:hypothetical protein